MKTLIVDDDFICRLLLQEMLKERGTVHQAANGKEALDAVKLALESGEPYDLICMDIMMPEMDGQKAVTEIRAMERERYGPAVDGAKIVMTTALGDVKNVSAAYGSFCDAYMVKPIYKDALVAELRNLKLVE